MKVGDVITASLGPRVRVLAVKAMGDRRRSAEIAKLLFEDLTAPVVPDAKEVAAQPGSPPGHRESGTGRPTKRDRRLIDRLKEEF